MNPRILDALARTLSRGASRRQALVALTIAALTGRKDIPARGSRCAATIWFANAAVPAKPAAAPARTARLPATDRVDAPIERNATTPAGRADPIQRRLIRGPPAARTAHRADRAVSGPSPRPGRQVSSKRMSAVMRRKRAVERARACARCSSSARPTAVARSAASVFPMAAATAAPRMANLAVRARSMGFLAAWRCSGSRLHDGAGRHRARLRRA